MAAYSYEKYFTPGELAPIQAANYYGLGSLENLVEFHFNKAGGKNEGRVGPPTDRYPLGTPPDGYGGNNTIFKDNPIMVKLFRKFLQMRVKRSISFIF